MDQFILLLTIAAIGIEESGDHGACFHCGNAIGGTVHRLVCFGSVDPDRDSMPYDLIMGEMTPNELLDASLCVVRHGPDGSLATIDPFQSSSWCPEKSCLGGRIYHDYRNQ